MKDTLNYLFDSNTLAKQEAKELLKEITSGKYNANQVASFLTVYRMRSITVDELEGFRDAMLDLCEAVEFPEYELIDLCGTGGDNKDTFNISTLASFVVAGAGVKVAKHGNYGVSSVCGSSNVMEHLGLKFTNNKSELKKQLEEANICVLHAPLFHPAMKYVGGIRKDLGFKTFFNMVGPMVNPTFPAKQFVGVFSLELARLYSYLYQKSGKDYVIVHSLDGYDEISLTSPFKMISKLEEKIVEPKEINFKNISQSDIIGGTTIEESAKIFMKVITGEGTEAQANVVIANAGLAIHCVNNQLSLPDCMAMAKESLDSKKALQSFNKLIAIN